MDGASRTYNAANQLTNDGTNSLTYDANGNLTNDGVNAYTWDRANRLLTAPGSTSYQYDGMGNRIQQTVSSVVTDYLLDIQRGLAQVLAETTSSNTTHFVHSRRGIHSRRDSSGDWHWAIQDGLGSVRGEVDADVLVEGIRHFGAYGADYGEQGSISTPFGYTGEQTDGNDLVYLRARYYNPVMGAFTRLDPEEGRSRNPVTLNRYAYVGGNPVNRSDPTGLAFGFSGNAYSTDAVYVPKTKRVATSVSASQELAALGHSVDSSSSALVALAQHHASEQAAVALTQHVTQHANQHQVKQQVSLSKLVKPQAKKNTELSNLKLNQQVIRAYLQTDCEDQCRRDPNPRSCELTCLNTGSTPSLPTETPVPPPTTTPQPCPHTEAVLGTDSNGERVIAERVGHGHTTGLAIDLAPAEVVFPTATLPNWDLEFEGAPFPQDRMTVHSIVDGTVVFRVDSAGTQGALFRIRTEEGICYEYRHVHHTTELDDGDPISAGRAIGFIQNWRVDSDAPDPSGPPSHVHLAIYPCGVDGYQSGDQIDPATRLNLNCHIMN